VRTAVAGVPNLPDPEEITVKKAIRTTVIGAGGIANAVHLPSLRAIAGCDLCAVCDLNIGKARAAAERFSIPNVYASCNEMLAVEKPDAAFVLVQPDQAFRIILDCIRAGVAVFAEKPPGVSLFQAEALAREASAAGIPCQIGFNRRFIPLLTQVRDAMKGSGSIVQVDGWFYKHSDAVFYDGSISAFECDTVHVVDLVRTLAGGKPRKAALLPATYGQSPAENAWNALISFDNGVTGTVHGNYETGGRVHGFALHAQRASAFINLGFGGEACDARVLYSNRALFSMGSQGSAEPDVLYIDGKTGGYHQYYGYDAEDRAFIAALLAGEDVPCGMMDALETMRLVELLRQNRL
jgi:virulence factor